eukprot:TRINITY_DN25435_c0_g2_i1.p1 TRINITY_DN25435_c0_g2~~TRINITY_DN25435_c0_g2_i1.p1  ORF type:complete len:312 (-),score=14.18 TRINITY_DN25435_c0_g2_i1:191-1015(-)
MVTILMVVFTCINFVFGIEISMFVSIVLTLVLVAVGAFLATVAVTNNDMCMHVDNVVLYKMEEKSVFITDFVRTQVIGINEQVSEIFWKQRLNVDKTYIYQQVDDIQNQTDFLFQDAPDSSREIKGWILNTKLLITKYLEQITYEQLNPFYEAFQDLTCCQFQEYLLRYNFSAILVGIFMMPIIIGLFIYTHRLRKLPPPMIGCGVCHVRSQQEFEINVPVSRTQGHPRILNYLIFSRGRRQQEATPYLHTDNSTTQNSQLDGNVPAQNQEKKV